MFVLRQRGTKRRKRCSKLHLLLDRNQEAAPVEDVRQDACLNGKRKTGRVPTA